MGDKAGGDSPGRLQQGNRKTRGRKEAKEIHKDEIRHQNMQNILSTGADHKHGRGWPRGQKGDQTPLSGATPPYSSFWSHSE